MRPSFLHGGLRSSGLADQSARVLASYEEVLPDAFSSDISVADGRVIGLAGPGGALRNSPGSGAFAW